MLKSITFEVIGDHQIVCAGCEERIEGLLTRLEGVTRVRAKARNQHVEVLFDPTMLNPNTIAERLASAGYATRIGSSTSESGI